jgi:MFS family permease
VIAKEKRWWALYVLCAGELMIVLDTTVVNVALPSIRESLGFSEASLVWVVNAYMLTYGGFLLLGGRLGDYFGHRRLFLHGIALFTAASLVCGFANSQWLLITARAVQGLGGAVVSAIALSLIIDLFTEEGERAKAMGIYGFVCAAGGSLGVLAGGLLTSALSWHWVFLVNIPIGIAVYMSCAARWSHTCRQGRGPARLRRRRDGDRRRRPRGVRHRQRQPAAARFAAAAARALPLHRSARRGAAHAAALLPRAQPAVANIGRRALGGLDVRLVLHLGAATCRTRSATRRCRSASPSCRRT